MLIIASEQVLLFLCSFQEIFGLEGNKLMRLYAGGKLSFVVY